MLNKIGEVFTKDYRERVECIEFIREHINDFKINNEAEDIEITVGRLKNKGFVSEFSIKVGKFK